MLKRLPVSAALVATALIAPAVVGSATASAVTTAASASAASSTAACSYRRDGLVWRCITPGAYCPKAARTKYGYAKVANHRYKCSVYSNGQWHWKRL
ncbi:hypothetical protein ABZ260_41815 [Streptosporangium sp. NPDC006013]|uniref:hypothetical protein n=1 Tax=Streptosporangium sp. NPDC006013 TaxID=3155596 RepID=UPI00339E793E